MDFFHNDEKLIREGEYTTDIFGERTESILENNIETPKFVYLSFNAPHEPTMAPYHLIEKMRKLHPDTQYSSIPIRFPISKANFFA